MLRSTQTRPQVSSPSVDSKLASRGCSVGLGLARTQALLLLTGKMLLKFEIMSRPVVSKTLQLVAPAWRTYRNGDARDPPWHGVRGKSDMSVLSRPLKQWKRIGTMCSKHSCLSTVLVHLQRTRGRHRLAFEFEFQGAFRMAQGRRRH